MRIWAGMIGQSQIELVPRDFRYAMSCVDQAFPSIVVQSLRLELFASEPIRMQVIDQQDKLGT